MSKLLDLFLGQHQQQAAEQRRAEVYKALIHYEAKIGGQLFGPVAKGERREFFCLDERTWVWHEEQIDQFGQRHVTTTRYDVRPNGVFKSQGVDVYQALSPEEARNFYDAVMLYYERVAPELSRLQQVS
jgi:hypothetical protein